MTLEHGGRLELAVREYEIPREAWIDLSTGISPSSWPVPTVPGSVWQRLPEEDGALESAAAAYYGCEVSSAAAGAGFPVCAAVCSRLCCPSAGWLCRSEVIPSTGARGRRLATVWSSTRIGRSLQALLRAEQVDHVLLINPNNPSAEQVSREHLELLHQATAESAGGFLVVDEAFADVKA